MNDVQKAKLVEIRRQLDEASTEYTEAYRKIEFLTRQEQDLLLLRTPS